MAAGPSAENVGADSSASNKDLTQSGANSVGKDGESTLGDVSAAYNPLNIGGNLGLPPSVSSPL
jgi:hypothetical protein